MTEPLISYLPRRATRQRHGNMPWLALAGISFIWIIPFIVLTVGLALLLPFAWFAAPVIASITVLAAHHAVMEARRRNGMMIVGYLDMAVRLNLPLDPFLRAAEQGESGRRARQLDYVRRGLATGMPMAQVLVNAPDVPDEIVSRLEASEPLGQLREALARSVAEDQKSAEDETSHPDTMLLRMYLLFMFFMIWLLLTFTMIVVIPKFKEIFRDFRTTLPPLTEFIMSISTFVAYDYWPLTLLAILGVFALVLLFISVLMSRMFMPSITLPDFKRLIDWCAWRLPITHTVQRDRGMAETCALLASAIRGGVPLPEALTQALSLPLNEGFRQRLDAFRRLILAGTAPADAARTAELPDLMAGLLAPTTARAPDAQLFTFLERYYRNRFSRTLMLLRGAIEPFLVLCLATLVGTTVLSLFLPLVKLIASVTFGRDGGAL